MAATENFPTTVLPSYGSSKTKSNDTHAARFGDGYSQRVGFGINNSADRWNVQFKNISDTNADAIETFLAARGWTTEAFLWTPPNEATELQWTLVPNSYGRTPSGHDVSNLTMQFQQEFDL